LYDAATSTISSRAIETGIANWEFTEVLGGLVAGDRVVSSIDREGVAAGAAVKPE
jgi:HlyD family secretion protein